MAKLSTLSGGNQFIKMMVYGPSGVGKTTFLTSFPGPIGVADFDGKIGSAARYLEVHNPDKLDHIEFENFQPSALNGGVKVYQKFIKWLVWLENLGKEGKFPYSTIGLDSLTTFAESLVSHIMDSNPGVKRVDVLTPSMQDYLMLSTNFKPIIHRLLALPCNVVVIGHISQDKDEVTQEINYRPALPGKLPELLPILFGEVYRAFTEVVDGKVNYKAQCRPVGKYVARTEIQGMPNVIPLSYESIVQVMTKGKT